MKCLFIHLVYSLLAQLQLSSASHAVSLNSILHSLRPLLSPNASIILPGNSSTWFDLITRTSYPRVDPGYLAIVEVATEEDISETITFANAHHIPFLAVSTGHGWTSTLNKLQGGLQISMRKLQSVQLSLDEKTAVLGGGSTQKFVTEELAKVWKRAVTGLCECTSVIGPAMGSGHSLLQSQHGFAADNIIYARVVLGNGTVVIASELENEDLFWALRGAGHNFGVVASFELRVYDAPKAGWTFTNFTFTAEKVERVFEIWNEVEKSYPDPGLVVMHGFFARNPLFDSISPTINLWILYEGRNTAGPEYVSAFNALEPATFVTTSNIPWSSLYDSGGWGSPSVCSSNVNFFISPSSFPVWSPGNMLDAYHLFANFTSNSKFSDSIWLLESYGRGAASIPQNNAVTPEARAYHLVTGPNIFWEGDDPEDRGVAETFAKEAKRFVRKNTGYQHSYVNYAYGQEAFQEIYGDRFQRLKSLKRKWDPEGKFGFYNPIG